LVSEFLLGVIKTCQRVVVGLADELNASALRELLKRLKNLLPIAAALLKEDTGDAEGNLHRLSALFPFLHGVLYDRVRWQVALFTGSQKDVPVGFGVKIVIK